MPSLLGDTVKFMCENCAERFTFELWSVVDTDERPDLAVRVMDASIRVFGCPACGASVFSNDPLLIYRPGEGGLGAMVLAMSSPDDGAAVQEVGGPLARWVAHQVGAALDEIGVIPTPWRLVPDLLQRNVARDLETPDALLDLSSQLGA